MLIVFNDMYKEIGLPINSAPMIMIMIRTVNEYVASVLQASFAPLNITLYLEIIVVFGSIYGV